MAISISLRPGELKQAERLAKRTNRSLSGLFREGLKRLQEEERFIEARVAEGLEDFKQGRYHGPFGSAKEASAYIERKAKERAAARTSKRRAR